MSPDDSSSDRQLVDDRRPSSIGDVTKPPLKSFTKGKQTPDNWAYAFADRRCRLIAHPATPDLISRALSSKAIGDFTGASADLQRAWTDNPNDVALLAALLEEDSEASTRAASLAIANHRCPTELWLRALRQLKRSGVRAAFGPIIDGDKLSLWCAWDPSQAAHLEIMSQPEFNRVELRPDRVHPLASGLGAASSVDIARRVQEPTIIRMVRGSDTYSRVHFPLNSLQERLISRTDHPSPTQFGLTIIVPVFDGAAETRACLESIRSQTILKRLKTRVVIVDDQGPDDALRAELHLRATLGEFTLLQNAFNVGFVMSANRAFAKTRGEDILLLNSDVVLSPSAIEILYDALYSNECYGVAVPLSNNSEATSFPLPHIPAPMPDSVELNRIAEAAHQANSTTAIEIFSGSGFCMLIRGKCFSETGSFSPLFLKGYGEDVDFCLRARENGFQTICAAGAYVGHHGSVSFKSHKRALVMRNRQIVTGRHSNSALRELAIHKIDPLKEARRRLEALIPPSEATRLFVGAAPGVAAAFAVFPENVARTDLGLIHEADSILTIMSRSPGPPKQLRYDLGDPLQLEACRSYLRRLDVASLIAIDPMDIPETVKSFIRPFKYPEQVLITRGPRRPTRPWNRHCPIVGDFTTCAHCIRLFADDSDRMKSDGRGLEPPLSVYATDSLAACFGRSLYPRSRIDELPRLQQLERHCASTDRQPRALGILNPVACVETDHLLTLIARALTQGSSSSRAIVFGSCLDDARIMATGSLFVTGPVLHDEYPRVLSNYNIGALFLADRVGNHWLLEALAMAHDLPAAYFDWGQPALAPKRAALRRNLAIEPWACDKAAVTVLLKWQSALF